MYAPDILAVAAAFEKYHIRIFVCVFFEIFVIVPGRFCRSGSAGIETLEPRICYSQIPEMVRCPAEIFAALPVFFQTLCVFFDGAYCVSSDCKVFTASSKVAGLPDTGALRAGSCAYLSAFGKPLAVRIGFAIGF